MPLNLSVAFLLVAGALFLAARPRSLPTVVTTQALLACVSLIGIVGLWAYWRDQQWFYEASSTLDILRMTPDAAIAIILLATGLWKHARFAPLDGSPHAILARRVYRTSSIIVVAVVVIVCLLGIAFFQSVLISVASENLSQVVLERRAVIEHSLTSAIHGVVSTTNPSVFSAPLRAFNQNPTDPKAVAQLYAASQVLAQRGFPAVAFEGADRGFLAMGGFINQPDAQIDLEGSTPASILSVDGFKLDVGIPVQDEAGAVGFVVVQQSLDWPDQLDFDTGESRRSLQGGICGQGPQGVKCFPLGMDVASLSLVEPSGEPLNPVHLATHNQDGIGFGFDRQGNRRLAAYRPVREFGLGMILEASAVEFFAPAQQKLEVAQLLLLALVACGLWLLYLQIRSLGGVAGEEPAVVIAAAPAAATAAAPAIHVLRVVPEIIYQDRPPMVVHPDISQIADGEAELLHPSVASSRVERIPEAFEQFLVAATTNHHTSEPKKAESAVASESDLPNAIRRIEIPPAQTYQVQEPSREELPNGHTAPASRTAGLTLDEASGSPETIELKTVPDPPRMPGGAEPRMQSEQAQPSKHIPASPTDNAPRSAATGRVKVSRLVVFLTLTGAFAAGVALTTGVFGRDPDPDPR